MSNQVYSNESRKFYALPGMNAYAMSGIVVIASSTGNAPVTVPTAGSFLFTNSGSVVDDSSLVELAASSLSILKEGVYSVKLVYAIENTENTVTNDVDYAVFMRLTRSASPFNGIIVDQNRARIPAPGSSRNGSTTREGSVNYNGYLKAGDVLSFVVENFAGTGLTILSNSTQLLVNKIY